MWSTDVSFSVSSLPTGSLLGWVIPLQQGFKLEWGQWCFLEGFLEHKLAILHFTLLQAALYKGRGAVSMPICATKERIGPANADQSLSTARQDCHHVYSMS